MFFLLLLAAVTVVLVGASGGALQLVLKAVPIPASDGREGELDKQVDAGPGYNGPGGIGDREIVVGPLLAAIPKGRRLLVDARLTIASKPPAAPGFPPTPCYAVGAYLEYDADRKEKRSELAIPPDCVELSLGKGPPGRYTPGPLESDVRFPGFRLLRRNDGIYFAYTWIRWREVQRINWLAYPHKLRLRWKLGK